MPKRCREDISSSQHTGLSQLGNGQSPVSSVLNTLLFDFGGVFPQNIAGPGINQLEGVQDVIANARLGLGGQTGQFAGSKEIGSLELLHIRVAGRGQLPCAL